MVITKFTHIIPVGHTKEKFLSLLSLKQFPVHRVILIVGKDVSASGEDKVYETAESLSRDLQGYVELQQRVVDKLDVLKGALDILDLIKEETKHGYQVRLNISGSLHTIGISCYIAALVSKTEIYSALPEYKQKQINVNQTFIFGSPNIMVLKPLLSHKCLIRKFKV